MSATEVKTFICVGQNYYGSGKTLEAAKKNMRGAGWHRHPSVAKKDVTVIMLSCEPADVSYRDGFQFSVEWPKDVVAMKYIIQM